MTRAGRRIAAVVTLVAAILGSPTHQAVAASVQRQVWQGHYDCSQGATGLTLTLQIGDTGQVQALFAFYPVTTNPGVPNGCFEMRGPLDTAGHLALAPGAWLLHPPGYVRVGLTADLSGDSLHGTVSGPGCSDVILSRITSQAGPTACLGAVS
jgi:hypothetical protein